MADEYVPASRAKLKREPGQAYTVVLDGHKIEVSRPDFIEQNQTLAVLYTVEKNPSRRGEIAHHLYTLDLPLFKAWDIFDQEGQKDYNQDAFLWTMTALDSYKKEKGSFIYWLRQIVKRARREYYEREGKGGWYCKACDKFLSNKNATGYHVSKGHNVEYRSFYDESIMPEPVAEDEESSDSSIALSRLEASMTPDKWEMVKMKMLDGLSVEHISAALGVHRDTARKKIGDAVTALRVGMVDKEPESAFLADGSEWLTRRQFAARVGVSYHHVLKMLNPNYSRKVCKWRIDPNDYSGICKGKIRYKINRNGKIEYPRLIERKDKVILKPDEGSSGETR